MFKKWETKPVLFVGTGLSIRYKALLSWKNLLEHIAAHIHPEEKFAYQKYSQRYPAADSKRLQKIAEDLSIEYKTKFFSGDLDQYLTELYSEDIRNGVDVFNLYLKELMSNNHYTDTYDKEKESFIKINNYISNIITTNYDKILEENFPIFTKYIGQDELLNNRVYNISELYKIHGCIDKPNSIVFNTTSYNEFESKQKYLSAKIMTLFIEYPIIFLGYSINDDNILAIFDDIKKCLNDDELNKMSEKLLFVEYVDDVTKEELISSTIKGIPMKHLRLNDYNNLYSSMTKINNKYSVGKLRQIQEAIANLVASKKSDKNARVTMLAQEDDDELAILIGSKDSIFKLGYESIDAITICEDIMFDKQLDSEMILKYNIQKNKQKFSSIPYLPLYKYLKDYPEYKEKKFIKDHIILNLDNLYNKSKSEKRNHERD
jgi:hypothetical protein